MINLRISNYYKKYITIFLFFAIFSTTSLAFHQVKIGIDFIGGSIIECEKSNIEFNNFKSIFKEKKFSKYISFESNSQVYQIKTSNDINQKEIITELRQILTKNNIQIHKIETIGASMTKEFIINSFLAVITGMIAIFCYIWIKFNIKFAIAATLSIFFNILAASFPIKIFDIELNLLILTAVLIIIGYCINDTIVIFDSIKNKSNGFVRDKIDEALFLVIKRSIITSLLTFFSSLSLLLIKDPAIQNFSIVVSFSIIIGTLSSIFLATSLLILLNTQVEKINNIKKAEFYNC